MTELLRLEKRLDLLEEQVAFQEIMIEELNRMVVAHQHDISRLQKQLCLLTDRLRMQNNSTIALQSEEMPVISLLK